MILVIETKFWKSFFTKTYGNLAFSSLKKFMHRYCVMFNTGTMLQANYLMFFTKTTEM